MIKRSLRFIKRKLFPPKEVIISGMDISKDYISRLLPANPAIIDCGAHIGLDSLQLAHIPGASVYSFEPVNHLFEKLEANTRHQSNIHRFQLALSNYSGTADFYVSSGDSDASSSLLKPKDHIVDHPSVYFEEVVKVKCQTLDDWAAANGIKRIDMLWLDMQGFEQDMLAASTVILPTVKLIHSEVSTKETYEGVKSYQEYRRFLESKGFKVLLEAIPAGYDMGNVLFIRDGR